MERARIFDALRYRDYRLFWFGQLFSVLGFQMMLVTQLWLVYDLTGSKLQLGLVGLSSAIPSILLNLFGGVVADKVDQRKLIMGVQAVGALVMAVLATLTLANLVQAWHVMLSAFLMGGLGAFDQPSRQAIFPRLIERRAMMNAVALNATVWQSTRIMGPAVGGAIILLIGPAYTFYVSTIGSMTFVVFLAAIRMPRVERARSAGMLRDMAEGVGFIRSHHIFLFLLGMVFFNSFFGLSYIQLMPVFQKDILNVNEAGYGFLLAMGGAGAISGTFLVAAIGNVKRNGSLLIGGAVAFGITLIMFAYSTWYPVSLGLVFLAGATSSVYMIVAQTSLHMLVPDQFRGRVMGFWGITYNLMPMGGFQAGLVANYLGAPFAVAIGGAAVVAFATLGAGRDRQVRRLGQEPQDGQGKDGDAA